MRKMVWALLCVLGTTMACAQSAKDSFNAFRDSVLNQQFVLRNFNGETKVYVLWTGTQFALDAPKWRTFGVLQVHSVIMKGGRIRLECDRHVVLWNDTNTLARYAVGDPVEISVDLQGGDAAQVLPKLRDAMFYTSTAEALAGVPAPLQKLVPAHVNRLAGAAERTTKPCDCSEHDPCASVAGAAGFVFPKATHTEDPHFSDQAKKQTINGVVVTAIIVDESGHIGQLWVARPLGYGLDEEAAKAALHYRFQPASCHNSPVSVPLMVEVSFQTF